MSPPPRFTIRQLVLAVVVGLVVGVSVFEVTGITGPDLYMGFCYPTIRSGFDPLTGLPHGVTLYCPTIPNQPKPPSTIVVPMSPEFAARRALPVPIGLLLGGGSVLLLASLKNSRRQRRGSDRSSSAAGRGERPAKPQVPEAVEAWLASHGHTLAFHEADGFVWADLLDLGGRMIWPRYGRGRTVTEAAERVPQRFADEQ